MTTIVKYNNQFDVKKVYLMDKSEFKEALKTVNMTKVEFADRINTSINTVNGWTQKGFPSWVDTMIELMTELQECMEINKEAIELNARYERDADGVLATANRIIEDKEDHETKLDEIVARLKEEMSTKVETEMKAMGTKMKAAIKETLIKEGVIIPIPDGQDKK